MTEWDAALRVAELFAADPHGGGGIVVRAGAGPVRDRFLGALTARLAPGRPVRRMPVGIGDDRLLGGLDLAATLAGGHPVAASGLLAEADGGVIVVPMAERLSPGTAARLCAALDTGRISVERDGFALRDGARFGVVALDEGDDEAPPDSLLDRLGFRVDLRGLSWRALEERPAARVATGEVTAVAVPPELLDALTGTAAALGVASLRAVMLAVRVTRAAAFLAGRAVAVEADAAEAARLILAPRATRLPAPPEAADAPEQERQPEPERAPSDGADADQDGRDDDAAGGPDPTADIVLEAARAAIPADLLARIAPGAVRSGRAAGRVGAAAKPGPRGRPAGSRTGSPRDGARLDVLATLRAAAPMQRLRGVDPGGRVAVRAADFRIVRRVSKARTTTIFVVDASGSSALHRLAEAKGAVELLLAECYVRRDRVALVTFRGRAAAIALPPTASLTRARRGLIGLPGGGGTPLAAALDAARTVAETVRRQDGRAVIVLLTDGRANVTRDGTGDRGRATDEARQAARAMRLLALPSLVLDTSPRPSDAARDLARDMDALYLPLPQADAGAMARAVRAAAAA